MSSFVGYQIATTEHEAREAWVAGVRTRLDETLFHVAHGLPTLPLDQYPCAKYPHCDQILGGGWGERFRVVENPDGTVTAYGRLT